jgi:uncharacterized lipoprotein YmbA
MNKKLLLLPVLFLAGCANLPMGHSAPVHYWRVDTPEALSTGSVSLSDSSILLKVRVTDALKSSRLAWLGSPNEVVYAESQRWAEPLDISAARVLRETMSSKYDRVETVPVNVAFSPDYRIEVVIDNAWPNTKGEVTLSARWWISDGTGKLLKDDASNLTATGWRVGDWRAYAVRIGTLLQNLAGQIDKDLSSLDEGR